MDFRSMLNVVLVDIEKENLVTFRCEMSCYSPPNPYMLPSQNQARPLQQHVCIKGS